MSFENLLQYALDAQLGAAASDKAVVNLLYTNLVGSAPTADIESHYVRQLQVGTYTQWSLASMAADTAENAQNIGLVGLAATGLAYTPA